MSSSLEVVKMFINMGNNPNIQDLHGDTLLTTCECPVVMEYLLKNGADPNIQNYSGNTKLIIETENSNIEMVSMLLKYGARPAINNNNGYDPLYYACMKGDVPIIKLLLIYEANLRYNNKTLLKLMCEREDYYVIDIFLSWNAVPHESLLPYMCYHDQIDIVRRLIKMGIDVNTVNPDKYSTGLMYACKNKNVDLVELLLKNGANPDIQGPSGWTALHFIDDKIDHNSEKKIIDIMKNKDVDMMIVDDDKKNALMYIHEHYKGRNILERNTIFEMCGGLVV